MSILLKRVVELNLSRCSCVRHVTTLQDRYQHASQVEFYDEAGISAYKNHVKDSAVEAPTPVHTASVNHPVSDAFCGNYCRVTGYALFWSSSLFLFVVFRILRCNGLFFDLIYRISNGRHFTFESCQLLKTRQMQCADIAQR